MDTHDVGADEEHVMCQKAAFTFTHRESSCETLQTLQEPHLAILLRHKNCLLNKNILDPNLGAISCFAGVQGEKVNDLAFKKMLCSIMLPHQKEKKNSAMSKEQV